MAFDKDKIKNNYSTDENDVLKEFYIPVLKESISYDRAVGYFTSQGLLKYLQGIDGLIKNNGKMRLVIGDTLSDDEYESINNSDNYCAIFKRLDEKWSEIFDSNKSELDKYRLEIFSWLLNRGFLKIKYAFRRQGLFHKKIGIAADANGGVIAFSGSMNETESAIVSNKDNPNGNSEEFSVYLNWDEDSFNRYGKSKVEAFNKVWNSKEKNTFTVDIPSSHYDKIKKIYTATTPPKINKKDTSGLFDSFLSEKNAFKIKIPESIELRGYQKQVVNNWLSNNGKGILQMATGTGKTITAISAAVKLIDNISLEMVVVICPYKHLAAQWVKEMEKFNFSPIAAYIKASNWLNKLSNALTYKDDKQVICVVVTSSTFIGDTFQQLINHFPKKTMIIGDEVHNYGANTISNLLPKEIPFRMGLSATPERWFDISGTNEIYNYFGAVVEPIVTLKNALEWGVLTEYYYHPIIVSLTDEEHEEYEELSEKIGKMIAMGYSIDEKEGPLSGLLIKRARLIASCKNKIPKLKSLVKTLGHPNKFIVYCGDGKVESLTSGSEVRQIDEVTRIMGVDIGLVVSKYTAETSPEDREKMQIQIAKEEIDGIIAIRCLDEGVDIPEIETAIILASSTNPKQFIQRRGRILRKSINKTKATIYDFIVTPPSDMPINEVDRKIVAKELKRCVEFADLAKNFGQAREALMEIQKRYNLMNL